MNEQDQPIDDWQEDGSGSLEPPAPVVAAAVIVEPPAAQATPNTQVDADSGTLEEHEAEEEARVARDQQGKFVRRDRAASQRATPAEVPLINEYTKRIKQAEAAAGADIEQQPGESNRVYELRRRAELAERRANPEAPRVSDPAPVAARPEPVAAPAVPRPLAEIYPVKAAADDPEPNLDDPKYNGDMLRAFKDQALWAGREALRQANVEATRINQERAAHNARVEMDQAWNARVGIAKSLNGSLDEKVLGTLIPPGTLLDAWIVRAGDKIGGAMLAYAFAHQDEVRHMLALPDMMDHNRALLLMEQKATAKPAVPASASRPVSRPPTPIRTAPPIPADQERSDDETLEEFERLEEKRTGGRRR